MKQKITFKLNQEMRTVEVEPNDTLLSMLREDLGIKSPKCGCGRGDCGTCTVLFNGKSVRSCLIFAIEADGQEIVTLEGICKDKITPLQQSFIEHNSFQCGFCAPGVILSTVELFQHNPNPSREEIKESIAGNLCRCTGYEPIVDAIMAVSKHKGG